MFVGIYGIKCGICPTNDGWTSHSVRARGSESGEDTTGDVGWIDEERSHKRTNPENTV